MNQRSITEQIAKQFHEVYFGGNWTVSNLKDQLSDVTWQQATQKVLDFNTIATLTYHIHYFVHHVSKALQGEPLTAKDKYSFNHPPIDSEQAWQNFLNQVFQDGENFVNLIAQLPDEKLHTIFVDEKYGTYYRNLNGIIEHTHYHLGQIALLKKWILSPK